MKFFYNRDAEGCVLEGEKLDTAPIKLGTYIVTVGTCIRYTGDGRPQLQIPKQLSIFDIVRAGV